MALSADFDPNKVYDMLVNNPRRILGIRIPKLIPGARANLTVFDPNHKWVYSKDNKKSKSSNTPLLGSELTGKPLYVYNNGKGKSLINF
jgi:dihydroorotase